jgi:hypothetical protein
MEVSMTLQEKLIAMKKETIATKPPELIGPLLQETENLVNSGIADKTVKVGDTLPEFTLPDVQGNPVSSKVLLEKGPLAISFYRGVW